MRLENAAGRVYPDDRTASRSAFIYWSSNLSTKHILERSGRLRASSLIEMFRQAPNPLGVARLLRRTWAHKSWPVRNGSSSRFGLSLHLQVRLLPLPPPDHGLTSFSQRALSAENGTS